MPVAAGRCLVEQGCSHRQAAGYLQLAPRTLRDWQHDFAIDPVSFHLLGRPPNAATTEQRNEVILSLDELGPGIGLPTLRDIFPDLARAALADVLRRYRVLWRRLHRQTVHVLHWTQPGSVWAVDFHGPRPAVDGTDPNLLAVRDLASGWQLLWLPVRAATAATVVRQLTGLFVIHGAPLVLKCDNGSRSGMVLITFKQDSGQVEGQGQWQGDGARGGRPPKSGTTDGTSNDDTVRRWSPKFARRTVRSSFCA